VRFGETNGQLTCSNISLVMHRSMSGSHYRKQLFVDIKSDGLKG